MRNQGEAGEAVSTTRDPTHGEGVLARAERKPGGKVRYNRAVTAILADDHVERAIAVLAEQMETGDRSSDKIRAATTLIELAIESDISAGTPGGDRVLIYVLNEAPGVISAAVDEARRRRALPVGGK